MYIITRTIIKNTKNLLDYYENRRDTRARISDYFRFYNAERHHQALGYWAPGTAFTSIPIEATH